VLIPASQLRVHLASRSFVHSGLLNSTVTIQIFLDVTPCRWIRRFQRFVVAYFIFRAVCSSRTIPRIEAVRCSLTLVPTYQSTRHHIPKDGNIHHYCCKKPQISQIYCKVSYILYGLVKSRKLRWTGHVARMGTREMHTRF
jgi:hypothetical protein